MCYTKYIFCVHTTIILVVYTKYTTNNEDVVVCTVFFTPHKNLILVCVHTTNNEDVIVVE